MGIFSTSGVSRYSIKWRRIIHKPLTALFGSTLKEKITLLRNGFIPNGRSTIYAATHVFYDDVASVCCCLEHSAYLLIGIEGADNTPVFSERLALNLNGAIVVNRAEKKSRSESLNTMVSILNKQGNVLIFPEGGWNLTPNLLIQKLHWGVLRAAEQTNANVVPIAVDLVENTCYVIIGENFNYSAYDNIQEATEGLTDTMATLVWELICMKQPLQRHNLDDTYWLKHIQAQYSRMPQKDQAKEELYFYRPKGEVSLGEVLAEMYGLEYKSMATDYEQHKRVQSLIDNWTKPVGFL